MPLELMRRVKLDEFDVNDRIFTFSCDPNIGVMPEKGYNAWFLGKMPEMRKKTNA